jgi:hypothetical protein
LLLATWNVRDFDSNKFGHGPRLAESFHYIAEVIAAFDLVAMQEVNEDMRPFEKVMDLLGPSWRYRHRHHGRTIGEWRAYGIPIRLDEGAVQAYRRRNRAAQIIPR